MKNYKSQVIQLSLKGTKYFSIELLNKAFDILAKDYFFDGYKGKLYKGNELIEEYSNPKEYNRKESFEIALDSFKRSTRNGASMLSRGYKIL